MGEGVAHGSTREADQSPEGSIHFEDHEQSGRKGEMSRTMWTHYNAETAEFGLAPGRWTLQMWA
jgi:hypothetical protein